MNPWHLLLFQPLVNLLILFYNLLGHNMGLAIIGLTVALRAVLIPFTAGQLKMAQKMKDLAPELERIKKEHGQDKQRFAQEQMKLYQKHGANPVSGCLPTIIQFVILIALFQALNQVLVADGAIVSKLNTILYPFLRLAENTIINTRFLYLDITKPDVINMAQGIKILSFQLSQLPGPFLISAAVVQFISSKMMMPKKTALQKAQAVAGKESKSNTEDMASMMQSQMLYLAPAMTLLIGFRFASGLVLYWLAFSLFMLVQQIVTKNKAAAI